MNDETIKRLSRPRADGHKTGLFVEALQLITARIPLLTFADIGGGKLLGLPVLANRMDRVVWDLRFAAWVRVGLRRCHDDFLAMLGIWAALTQTGCDLERCCRGPMGTFPVRLSTVRD
jgi:hypothetical protein